LHYNLGVGTYLKIFNRLILKPSLILNLAPNKKMRGLYETYHFFGKIPESTGSYAIRQSSLGINLTVQYGGKLDLNKSKKTKKRPTIFSWSFDHSFLTRLRNKNRD